MSNGTKIQFAAFTSLGEVFSLLKINPQRTVDSIEGARLAIKSPALAVLKQADVKCQLSNDQVKGLEDWFARPGNVLNQKDLQAFVEAIKSPAGQAALTVFPSGVDSEVEEIVIEILKREMQKSVGLYDFDHTKMEIPTRSKVFKKFLSQLKETLQDTYDINLVLDSRCLPGDIKQIIKYCQQMVRKELENKL